MKKITAAAVFFCSLLSVLSLSALAANPAAPVPRATSRGAAYTEKEIALRTSIEKLFSECLKRQRMLAGITIYGAGDPARAQAQLGETADSIGKIFKTYYGDQAGGQLADLFNQYVQLSSVYVDTAKARGNTAAVIASARAKADELAAALNTGTKVRKNARLSLILKGYFEAVALEIDRQASGARTPDTGMYTATFKLNQELADAFATRIVRQFPEQFPKP